MTSGQASTPPGTNNSVSYSEQHVNKTRSSQAQHAHAPAQRRLRFSRLFLLKVRSPHHVLS